MQFISQEGYKRMIIEKVTYIFAKRHRKQLRMYFSIWCKKASSKKKCANEEEARDYFYILEDFLIAFLKERSVDG